MAAERRSQPPGHRGLARSHVSPNVEREVRVPLSELADKRGALETEAFIRAGELTPAMEAEWDAIAGSARLKIYRTGLVVCAEDAQIAAIDHEIERLQAVRRARVNRNEKRKDHLAFHMGRLDIRVVEGGPLCTVTLQKNAVVAVSSTDPSQPNLFASHDEASPCATARNSHVRVR